MHLLVQFVIIFYQTLAVPIYDVELKVCLDAQKHFEVECELISPTLLVGHIDVKIFDIPSEPWLRHASNYPLFVLFTIYERAERLIEVDQAYVYVLRVLVLIQQLYALCLPVDLPEALLDLAVQVPLAVGADVCEVAVPLLDALQEGEVGQGETLLKLVPIQIDQLVHSINGFGLGVLACEDQFLSVPELVREVIECLG